MKTVFDLTLEHFTGAEVRSYTRLNGYYTRLGLELERVFREAVFGARGGPGEPDVTTALGGFEFCASAVTKNSAGGERDAGRGVRVQLCGEPRLGWISGEEFLTRHGIDPARADVIRAAASERAAWPLRQLELSIPEASRAGKV